ncbi:low temperature requirement protein A [Micromonospora sp. DT31]|uniref:low temperature requirement protein A n=1 Tax=Micromonospora sp. DT31 TaxID=3393434 RepID=UPI003CF4B1F3
MGGDRWRKGLGAAAGVAPATRVDKFEIFFDLVFVVSFFVITRATAADVTPRELLHALLVLAVLWWCWVVHSAVAARLRLGEGFVPILMVLGMAALFTFALALPQTFGDLGQGSAGPILVTVSYVVIRLVHTGLYWYATADDRPARRKLWLFLPEAVISSGLLLMAALLPTRVPPEVGPWLRDGLWIAVVVTQYSSGLLAGADGWKITSAEHWTERYDLILIIALGESVISVGVGGNLLGQAVTWPAIPAAILGIVFTAALWWAHFDMIGPAARITLHAAQGRARVALARDAYAYLYLPLIAGVILFAIGAEELVRTVTDPAGGAVERGHGPAVPMLFGGVMLYFAANMAFQWRALRTLSWTRVGTLVLLAVVLPVAERLPALGALALLTAICVALVCVELVVFADSRVALRRLIHQEKVSAEESDAAWRARWREDPR